MEGPQGFQLLAWLREAAQHEGGAVLNDVLAPSEATPADPSGFASLAGQTLTFRFASSAEAQAFLGKEGAAATILELLEWSSIAIVVEVGKHRFSLRDGIGEAEEELKKLGGAED